MELINLDELPARMRVLAEQMDEVGASIIHHSEQGLFAYYGTSLRKDNAPLCREMAEHLQGLLGGSA